MEFIDSIVQAIISFLSNFGIFAGIILILLESVFPPLPLSVFIALNSMTYGQTLGVIISWLSTVFGCSASFFLFRKLFRNKFNKILKEKDLETLSKLTKQVSNISLPNLTILIAIPFTPAFLVNIACGLSNMKYRKFLMALLVSKFIMVFFWSYIGTTFLESITNVSVLIKIIVLLALGYIVSKILEKRLKVK